MNKQKITAYMFFAWAAFIFTGCSSTNSTQMYLEAETKNESALEPGQETAAEEAGYHLEAGGSPPAGQPAASQDDGGEADCEPDTCFVYVCGAVKYPGVFELPQGSRIYEAIAKAGGIRGDACVKGINQAGVLADGDMIEILTQKEYEDLSRSGGNAISPGESAGTENTAGGSFTGAAGTGSAAGSALQDAEGLVDINTADAAQLMTLKGVGEAKAAAILAYREENGRFSDISEIKNVRGIGESVYAGIKDKIKVT